MWLFSGKFVHFFNQLAGKNERGLNMQRGNYFFVVIINMSKISVTGDKVLINGYKHIDLPIGTIIMNAGNNGSTSFGSAFLLCDGTLLEQSAYQELYNVIGNKYDTAATGGYFRLPNFVDRFPMGLQNVGGSALTATDPYAATTTRQGGNTTIQQNQFFHGHTSVSPTITGINAIYLVTKGYNAPPRLASNVLTQPYEDTETTISSSSHDPPYYTLNYFIYTGKGVIG